LYVCVYVCLCVEGSVHASSCALSFPARGPIKRASAAIGGVIPIMMVCWLNLHMRQSTLKPSRLQSALLTQPRPNDSLGKRCPQAGVQCWQADGGSSLACWGTHGDKESAINQHRRQGTRQHTRDPPKLAVTEPATDHQRSPQPRFEGHSFDAQGLAAWRCVLCGAEAVTA